MSVKEHRMVVPTDYGGAEKLLLLRLSVGVECISRVCGDGGTDVPTALPITGKHGTATSSAVW